MKFTLNANINLFDNYLLQQDGTWKQIKPGDPIVPSQDKLFSSIPECTPYLEKESTLSINGIDYIVNPQNPSFHGILKEAIVDIRVYREQPPRRFNRMELVEVIASGHDSVHSRLVLTLDGYFELWEPKESTLENPIAVRHETFCAGNNYVGKSASLDRGFIQETYLTMLEGWQEHIQTGKIDIYRDCRESKLTEEELWAKIEKSRLYFKPI